MLKSFYVIGIYIVLSMLFVVQSETTLQENIEMIAKSQKDITQNTLSSYMKDNRGLSESFNIILNNNTDIPKLMYNAKQLQYNAPDIRETIHSQILPYYTELKKFNLLQLHFHDNSVRSFVRMNKYEKYGDSLIGIRPSVEYVFKNKKPIQTFEPGRVIDGFRYVYPIFYKDEFVGSVGLSFSADIPHDYLGVSDSVVVFKDNQVNTLKWKESNTEFHEFKNMPGYVHKIESHKNTDDIIKVREEILKSMFNSRLHPDLLTNKQYLTKIYQNHYVSVFQPIMNNITGKSAGYLWTIKSSPEIASLERSTRVDEVFTFMVMILIIFITYRTNQLNEESKKRMQRIVENDPITGLLNRWEFDRRLKKMFDEKEYEDIVGCIILIDITQMKKLSARYGYKLTDMLITRISQTLNDYIDENEMVARWRDDEFIIYTKSNIIETKKQADIIHSGLMSVIHDSVMEYDLQVAVVDLTLTENKEDVYSKMYNLIFKEDISDKVQI